MVDTGGAQRHPEATRRLLNEWEHGDLAKKIRWGEDGDFNRCVVLATRIFGQNGVTDIDPKAFCANRHKGALGTWPGDHNGDGKRDHRPGDGHRG